MRFSRAHSVAYDSSPLPLSFTPMISYTAKKYSSPSVAASLTKKFSSPSRRSQSPFSDSDSRISERHSIERTDLSSVSGTVSTPFRRSSVYFASPSSDSLYGSVSNLTKPKYYFRTKSIDFNDVSKTDQIYGTNLTNGHSTVVNGFVNGTSKDVSERCFRSAVPNRGTSGDVSAIKARARQMYRRTLSLEPLYINGMDSNTPTSNGTYPGTPDGGKSRREGSPALLSIQEGLEKVNEALIRHQIDSEKRKGDLSRKFSHSRFYEVPSSASTCGTSPLKSYIDATTKSFLSNETSSGPTRTKDITERGSSLAPTQSVLDTAILRYSSLGYRPRFKSGYARSRLSRLTNPSYSRISDSIDWRREIPVVLDNQDKLVSIFWIRRKVWEKK